MTTRDLAISLRLEFGDVPTIAGMDSLTASNPTLLLHEFRNLIHGFMERLDWERLEKALRLAEAILHDAEGELQEMFYVSFQEHLLLRGRPRHRRRAIALMPPDTRDWYLKQWPESF